jgi:hypothetical protein
MGSVAELVTEWKTLEQDVERMKREIEMSKQRWENMNWNGRRRKRAGGPKSSGLDFWHVAIALNAVHSLDKSRRKFSTSLGFLNDSSSTNKSIHAKFMFVAQGISF